MNNPLIVTIVATTLLAGGLIGCEEKPSTPNVTDKLKDAAKSTTDAARNAAKSATDTVKDAAAKLQEEIKGMVDTAKTRLDALTKGGSSVAADKKPEFDKVVSDLSAQFKSLSDGFAGLKDHTGDALTKKIGELKDIGAKLMDGIKAAADKYGIKI
jgi:uncharacterized phage infection (PIP) family protein YhgE